MTRHSPWSSTTRDATRAWSRTGAVWDLDVIAYLGVPLRSREGHVLGALCAIDTQPRAWSADDLEVMRELAAGAEGEIHTGAERRDHERLQQVLASHHDVHDMIVSGAPLAQTLHALVQGVEQQSDGML